MIKERIVATLVKPQRGLDAIQPYVPGKPIEEVQREYGLTDVIKLASNENPLGASPKVLAALQAALTEINYYPDAQCYYLREALGKRLGLPADHIAIGNGADGLIREACVAHLEDGDEVIVSRSSFPVYDISTVVMRGRLIKTPLKNDGLDLQAMAAASTPHTKIIFVCNPNNPTGTVVTAAEVEAFVADVPDHVLVVMDEAYYEFVDSGVTYPDSLRYVRAGRQNMLVLRTFSKVYGMAGLRLGYGIACPDVMAALAKVRESFPVNRLAQAAGLAAMDDAEFLQRTVEMNRTGRLYLYRELERLGLRCVRSHTNFVLVEVGPRAGQVFQELLRRGVIVRPGNGYDLPNFLRITVGHPEQNARLVEALESVLHTLS
jgi:histidinol-phosphate aminotransferase